MQVNLFLRPTLSCICIRNRLSEQTCVWWHLHVCSWCGCFLLHSQCKLTDPKNRCILTSLDTWLPSTHLLFKRFPPYWIHNNFWVLLWKDETNAILIHFRTYFWHFFLFLTCFLPILRFILEIWTNFEPISTFHGIFDALFDPNSCSN